MLNEDQTKIYSLCDKIQNTNEYMHKENLIKKKIQSL